jgi:methenyltetrahydromethanopterin cyclohydrolase
MTFRSHPQLLKTPVFKGRPLFGLFSPVLGSALLAVFDSSAVQRSSNDMITHTGKVFYTAPADEDNAVFLKVMTLSANVGDDFLSI